MARDGYEEHQRVRDIVRDSILAYLPKVEPGIWCELGQVFGSQLADFKESEPFIFLARFKDVGQFSMLSLGGDVNNLYQDKYGYPICYPLGEPLPNDVPGVFGGGFRMGRYSSLYFSLETYNWYDQLPHTYRLSLRLQKKVFISECPSFEGREGHSPEYHAGFAHWCPLDSGDSKQSSVLYVPIDFRKLAILEIMLEERCSIP